MGIGDSKDFALPVEEAWVRRGISEMIAVEENRSKNRPGFTNARWRVVPALQPMLHSDGEKFFEPYASWLRGFAGGPAACGRLLKFTRSSSERLLLEYADVQLSTFTFQIANDFND